MSPTGSFEHSNFLNNDLEAEMGIIDSNRNVIDKKIIDELRAANEK